MDKFQNKIIKVNLDSKKNENINSKNNLELKQGNQISIAKNIKKTEVTSKITGDVKQEDISVENLDLNENGVPKNQMNSTNSSLFEYLKLSVEAIQIQNEKMETMINQNSELIDYLGEEQSDISENCNFLKELIEMNNLLTKSEITKIDEQINIRDNEIGDIEKLKDLEEKTLLNDIKKEIEEMVVKTEQKKVN